MRRITSPTTDWSDLRYACQINAHSRIWYYAHQQYLQSWDANLSSCRGLLYIALLNIELKLQRESWSGYSHIWLGRQPGRETFWLRQLGWRCRWIRWHGNLTCLREATERLFTPSPCSIPSQRRYTTSQNLVRFWLYMCTPFPKFEPKFEPSHKRKSNLLAMEIFTVGTHLLELINPWILCQHSDCMHLKPPPIILEMTSASFHHHRIIMWLEKSTEQQDWSRLVLFNLFTVSASTWLESAIYAICACGVIPPCCEPEGVSFCSIWSWQ